MGYTWGVLTESSGIFIVPDNQNHKNGLTALPFHLPSSRAVTGTDVASFREWFGLSVDECRVILGIPTSSWYKITMDEAEQPLKDPAIALLIRYYARHPDEVPFLPTAEVQEIEEILQDIPMCYWGILLGRESASGHRWTSKHHHFKPVTARLAYYLVQNARKDPNYLQHWKEDLVNVEATARGVENIWSSGSWNPKRGAKTRRTTKLVRKR